MLNWNPGVRAFAHLAGAFAIPAGGALASTLVMHGVESAVNFGINLYNKSHPENEKEAFEINPKVKDAIKLISTAIVGIAYTYGTLQTEVDQFANSGIFQTGQYLADIGGSLAGIAVFNKLDIKDTAATGLNLLWTGGKFISKVSEKINGKNKDSKDVQKQSQEKQATGLQVEEIEVASEATKEAPSQAWDLSLYKSSEVSQTPVQNTHSEPNTSQTHNPSNIEIEEEDEINM